ncbi:MAG: hypothetical protein Q8N63_00015 [Nanoarchaeota archaeon]|nr:hypothetical protein [Nanoarchaeota archaeon]
MKKSYFKERTAREIKELNIKQVYNPRNLVRKILDLDPSIDGLELRVRITPEKFFRGNISGEEASRKCYKHGELIALSQPKTQAEAYECKDIPLKIRERDFDKLKNMREEDINYIGYSFRPVQGRDRIKRVVPFVWLLEAARLYAYAENLTNGIKINDKYKTSERVSIEGAEIICEVPSRTKKQLRYKFALKNVPIDGNTERRAIVWGIKPILLMDEENEPLKGMTQHELYKIKYNYDNSREGSDVITWYPHYIAAYFKLARKLWDKERIITPSEMSPFACVSQKEVNLYKNSFNNIIIFDPTLTSKDKLRKLHLDEKSLFIGKSIGIFGPNETMYCDIERDGNLRNYKW